VGTLGQSRQHKRNYAEKTDGGPVAGLSFADIHSILQLDAQKRSLWS